VLFGKKIVRGRLVSTGRKKGMWRTQGSGGLAKNLKTQFKRQQ